MKWILAATLWTNAPVGNARQDQFPYPGQCWTIAPIDGVPACTIANAKSFACEPSNSGFPNQTAGGWGTCGSVTRPTLLNPVDPATQTKFQFEVLNPPDYKPDTTKFPGSDYYEVAVHESWGFQAVASAGLFPDPTKNGGTATPDGKQWTGLLCPGGGNCGVAGKPLLTPVWGVGQSNMSGGPVTQLLTGLGLFKPATTHPEWSRDNFIATWPSISIRGTKGRPVIVKWINEFPNNHLFCSHPEAADWPCAIDRTFMGVKATIDPQKAPASFQPNGLPYFAVNQFGSPMQPDNSWVTHLHGGEIPPSTDGFAEKWFGNIRTGRYYSPARFPLDPAFGAPYSALTDGSIGALTRPGGDPALTANAASSWSYDTYSYPMVNQEATIWFHDHTLGKTHVNVVAGPAGFFPVKDPAHHFSQVNGVCSQVDPAACEYTWIDPVTEPRDSLNIPKYDLFLALQDRSFNDDGSFNFPNGMNQPQLPPAVPGAANYPACLTMLDLNGNPAPTCTAPGATSFTPGVNPQVHPQWVPEYFNDHMLVNGVIWPKKTVAAGWYRVRMVNGSDARCYKLGFGTVEPAYSSATQAAPDPVRNVTFTMVANEQGYLQKPALNQKSLVMCPGERYEILIDFAGKTIPYTDATGTHPAFALPGHSVFMNNNAEAPFPGGVKPQKIGSPFAHLASVMRFDVSTTPGVLSCLAGAGGTTWPNPANGVGCMSIPGIIDQDFIDLSNMADCPKDAKGVPNLAFNGGMCVAFERQLYLNERVDGTTGTSMGLQINGVPFEYDVTETPRAGNYERWKIINATVDAHPIHPHLTRFQIINRQHYNKPGWLTALCGSKTCEPGAAPGGIQQLTPNVTPFLVTTGIQLPGQEESSWKDVMVAYPENAQHGGVLTFVGKWDGGWAGAHGECVANGTTCFEPVWSGPYVWHCHINSHEDSEMMRSLLVVK